MKVQTNHLGNILSLNFSKHISSEHNVCSLE
nr:MAG TPA: hypothetical protein [Caudoviricetes sp.]